MRSRFNQLIFCLSFIALPVWSAPVVLSNIQGLGFDQERELVNFQVLVFDDSTGVVLARGGQELMAQYPTARQLDGQGKALLPGLIDGHGHVLGLGQTLSQVDLRTSSSEAQAVAQVTAFAKSQPQAQWIIGRGWNQVLWPTQQFPSRALLDQSLPDRPVWLARVDGHAGWANSKALQLAGIDHTTPDPAGGQILRDAKGQPTGVLIDNAMQLVERHIPATNEQERQAAITAAFDHLLALGITSTHDAGIDALNLHSYQQLQQQQQIPLRLYVMLAATAPEFASWLAKGPIDDPLDFLDIRAVKIFSDGALGSRGAALIDAYSDKTNEKGLLVTAPDALTTVMKQTLDAGFQANVHAIGDYANKLVLDRFALLTSDTQRRAGRHRIEHAQVVAPNDIPRFAQLHILPSMQPSHATSDKNMALARLGVARLRGAYAWRSFIDQRSRIVGGSDYPVELANPFHGIHAAVTRQDHNNQPAGGWLPAQKLTLVEALRAFTVDAAYGAHQDERMGSLLPGMWADFILIDRNIQQVPVEQLWQTQVLQTWVGGQLRYQRQH